MHGVRWLFVLILAATAIGKLLDVPGFVDVLATYRALPQAALWPVAVAVIAVELLLAVALARGRGLRRDGAICGLLHVGYAAWAGLALARGLELDNCGCFGVFLARPLSWQTVVEDSVAAALALAMAWAARPADGR